MFDFGSALKIFDSPLVVRVVVTVVASIVLVFAYLIIRNVRGGFGKMGRPKTHFVRCISITSANVFCLYKLKVEDEFVVDKTNQLQYHLYSDALIPRRNSGDLYLPLDTRCAVPLYLLEPENWIPALKRADKELDFIWDIEDDKASEMARKRAEKANTMEMQKFALICVMLIFLIIVIAILVMKIL